MLDNKKLLDIVRGTSIRECWFYTVVDVMKSKRIPEVPSSLAGRRAGERSRAAP